MLSTLHRGFRKNLQDVLRELELRQFLESDFDQGRVGKLSMRSIDLRSVFFDFRDWGLCDRENLVLWEDRVY